MKLLLILFVFTACASQSNLKFEEEKYDALRSESLHGHTPLRLENYKKKLTFVNDSLYTDRLFSTNKKSSMYWNALGVNKLNKGEYSQALFNFKLALGLAKNSQNKAIIINNQGIVFAKLGHQEQASAMFKMANRTNPKALTPRYNLSMIYLANNWNKKAARILVALYKKKPNGYIFAKNLSIAYYNLGQYTKAAGVLSIFPSHLHQKHNMQNFLEKIANKNLTSKKEIQISKR